ncbi:MAG TPA: DNA methyltransferase [Candidatus Paceibacterota bacterium]|nr:DNA methyltransferase [Candidatus Paceibacterota bacterium]
MSDIKKFMLINKDALSALKDIPDNTIHTVATSPPYWQLRNYFVSDQLGQEKTPEKFIDNLVEICREVKRVLRKDGTFWLNIGDGYNSTAGHKRSKPEWQRKGRDGGSSDKKVFKHSIIKQKDLIGMPWRLAFALQEDGWHLRCDIIWNKTNPMPDGAKDRPTRGHEYIFLLTKSQKYFYDYYAVLEDTDEHPGGEQGFGANYQEGTFRMDQERIFTHYGKRNKRSVWETSVSSFKGNHFACVDEETECLTKRGWKKYFELKEGEDIASFDMSSEKIKWTKLLSISIYDYNGDLIEIAKPSLNFLMTPNHRVIYKAYNGRARKYTEFRIKRADEFSNGDKLLISSDWEDNEIERKITKNMSELLGWISSEGHYTKNKVKIYQSISANREKVERIRFLLDDIKIDYKYSVRNRFFISQKDNKKKKSIEAIFSINNNDSKKIKKIMPLKKPTVELMNESNKVIKSFLKGFVLGDGHIRKDDGRKCIIQKDKDTMDILQMLCFKVGYSTNLKQRKDKNWVLYIRENKFSGIRNTNGTKRAIINTYYKGTVWCPSTKYTTFVARRNGNIMITGNTFPTKLIEPCVRAGTSEYGCCVKCGTPWNRKFEKIKKEVKRKATPKRFTESGVNMYPEMEVKKEYQLFLIETGWEKQCKCDTDEVKPCIVLDPFSGMATTGLAAFKCEHNYIGVELNKEYLQMSRERLSDGCSEFIKEVTDIKEL